MLRPLADPFLHDGGMRLVAGNLGRAIFKTSAVAEDRWTIEAPCRIFSDQDAVLAAFKAGELDRDVVVVVRFQGPRANGMPELHKLTPRARRAPGQGPPASRWSPTAACRARAAKSPPRSTSRPKPMAAARSASLRDGDIVRLCAPRGSLEAVGVDLAARDPADTPPAPLGTGRELFAFMRHAAPTAEEGGSAMLAAMESAT